MLRESKCSLNEMNYGRLAKPLIITDKNPNPKKS